MTILAFVMKPLSCYSDSAVAVSHGGCAPNMALWEVVSPSFAVLNGKKWYQRYYLHATCSGSSKNLRVIKDVSAVYLFCGLFYHPWCNCLFESNIKKT